MRRAAVQVAVLAVLVTILPQLTNPTRATAADPRPVPGTLVVRITDDGFVPSSITLAARQVLQVENATSVPQTFTASDGWVDSGLIPPGGRFVAATAAGATGTHPISSTANPAFKGSVSVGILDLPGPDTQFVSGVVPTTWVGPTTSLDVHPDLGIYASRDRAVISFAPTVRTAAANLALADAGVTVLGGLPQLNLFAVGVPDAGNFDALDAALVKLRASPLVTVAALDAAIAEPARVPRPEQPALNVVDGADWSYEVVTAANGEPAGRGGNNYLESSRAPQSWNLLGALSGTQDFNLPQTVIVDPQASPGHPDAPYTVQNFCSNTGVCTDADAGPHANGVASVIGAPLEGFNSADTDSGLEGMNPVARTHVVPLLGGAQQPSTLTDFVQTLDLILTNKGASIPRVRVLALPLSGVVFARNAAGAPDRFIAAHGGAKRCGPGANDDAGGTQICTPANLDPFLNEIARLAEASRSVAARMADQNILMVVAAGNESGPFTLPDGTDRSFCIPYNDPNCDRITLPSQAVQPLARLARNWGSGTPPIVVVESSSALEIGIARDGFSNTGGDVSAPGLDVLGANVMEESGTYSKFLGTSISTGVVAGLAGYLAALRPANNYAALRTALISTAREVADGAPRVDAYAAAMSLTGSTVRMVDINDASPDGNQRVVRGVDGVALGDDDSLGAFNAGAGRTDAADGKVDMRDLRRYRDAFLQLCRATADVAGCPATNAIRLDGQPENPHFDLNLDGCRKDFTVDEDCDVTDFVYARMDFNGDGRLAPVTAPVAIDPATGAPTSGRTALTDLDVLRSVWGTGTAPATAGWTKADLDKLLVSADIQVELSKILSAGATSVDLRAVNSAGAETPVLTTNATTTSAVLTVPIQVADGDDTVQLVATAKFDGAPSRSYVSPAVKVIAGQDITLQPCIGQGTIEVPRHDLIVGDALKAKFRYKNCEGDTSPVGGLPVTVTSTTNLGFAVAQNETAPDGTVDIDLTAGLVEGDESLSVQILVGGVPVVAKADFRIHKALKIWYRYRQTNLDYRRTATNDYDETSDDCNDGNDPVTPAARAGCFSSTTTIDEFFEDTSTGFERQGSITTGTAGGTGVLLDERGRHFERGPDGPTSDVILQHSFSRTTPTGTETQDDTDVEYRLAPGEIIDGVDWSHPFTDELLEDTSVTLSPDALEVSELGEIGLLDYPYTYACRPHAGSFCLANTDDMGTRVRPRELLMMGRLDNTSMRHSDVPDEPLRITKDSNGNYEPFNYCGVVERDFSAPPRGYWKDSDFDAELRFPELRNPNRTPGSRTAPIYFGELSARVEFVAVVTDGAPPTPAQLEFPSCTKVRADLRVGVEEDRVVEGVENQIAPIESGDYPGATYLWNLGDGTISTEKSPKHTYDDDGLYTIVLTRQTSAGVVETTTRDIVVQNQAPYMTFASAEAGTAESPQPKVHTEVHDFGPIDDQSLVVSITSTTPGFKASPGRANKGGTRHIDLLSQAPGTYQLTVKVTDKDGASSSLPATLFIPEPVGGGTGGGGLGRPAPAFAPAANTANAASAAAPDPVPHDPTPVAAFTLSAPSAVTGVSVTIRNASRAKGVPVAGSFLPGDGRAATTLTPGATKDLSHVSAGIFTLSFSTTTVPIATATTTLTVTGPTLAPVLTYTGPVAGDQGLSIPARATYRTTGGIAVAGVPVRFTLGPNTVTGTTDAAGVALAPLVVPGPAGPRTLVTDVDAFASLPAATASTPFTVGANSVPLAEAGGPYVVGPDSVLRLAGSATDPDGGSTFTYQWDLDIDGAFDDATGPEPSVPWSQVQALVCGGTCELGADHDIGLRVTDPDGGTAEDVAQVQIEKEFSISVNPGTALLVPGASTTVAVDVATTSGFDGLVDLDVVGLPVGVRASITPNRAAPPFTGLLTLTADNDADEAAKDITITARSAGITRTVKLSVGIEFGLIPVCTGTVTGRITNALTGDPVPDLNVNNLATTNADGVYRIENVAVSSTNGPRDYNVRLNKTGFFETRGSYRAACGVTVRTDFQMSPRLIGQVQGTVYSRPTGQQQPRTPLAGASVSVAGSQTPILTDAEGKYLRSVALPAGGAETQSSVFAQAPNHHSNSTTYTLKADEIATADVVLERRCTATVQVRVINETTGAPVVGARVSFGFHGDLITDAAGRTSGLIALNPDGAATSVQVSARGPASGPQSTNGRGDLVVTDCDTTNPIDVGITFPREIRGILKTTVIDDETGEPIAGASIQAFRGGATQPDSGVPPTDGAGVSSYDLRIGFGTPLSIIYRATASKTGYLMASSTGNGPGGVAIKDGETTEVTVRLQKQRFGAIEGRVYDVNTGEPIEGLDVNLQGYSGVIKTVGEPLTGPDGRYRFEKVPLGLNGAPTISRLNISRTPGRYGSFQENVTIGPDLVTKDIPLLGACQAATIRGRVVNAVDRTPIEGATVSALDASVGTTSDGRFALGPLDVDDNNEPRQVFVSAAKTGFVTATKRITLTCGADIVLDFGTDADGSGTIVGTVTDEVGAPVVNAAVAGGFGGFDRTDAQGKYTLPQAPAGTGGTPRDWPVSVTPPLASGLGTASRSVTVRKDETTTADFVLGVKADAPPTSGNQSVTTVAGTPVPITLFGVDPDGDAVTFTVTPPPAAEGSLSGTAPSLTFTPATGFTGSSGFSYTVTAGGKTSAPGVVSITVTAPANKPPTVVLTVGPQAAEGSAVTLSAAGQDSDGTVASYAWDLDDDDGAFDDATGSTASITRFDNGDAPIKVRVVDDKGAIGTAEGIARFTNVAPEVTLAGPATADDQGRLLALGTITDPGSLDTHTATVDWGEGSGRQPLTVSGRTVTLDHQFQSGGVFNVEVRACDDDGACDELEFGVTVEVEDRPPTAEDLAVSTPAGEAVDMKLKGNDPDGDALTFTVATQPEHGTLSGTAPDLTYTPAADFEGEDSFTFTTRAGGKTSDPAKVTITVTAGNLPPVAAISGPSTAVEGGSVKVKDTSTDPDGDIAEVEWDLDGNGTYETPGTVDGEVNATRNDEGTLTVGLRVTDDDGAKATATHAITFTNAPPSVLVRGDLEIDGMAFTRSGSFTDPGVNDVHTATVDWGEGGGAQPLALTGNNFNLSHTYGNLRGARARLTSFTVTISVCDEDACGVRSFAVAVAPPGPTPAADLGVSIDAGGPYLKGRSGRVSVVVTHLGPSDAAGVRVVLTAPSGVTLVAAKAPPGWTCAVAARKVTCTRSADLGAGRTTIRVRARFGAAGTSQKFAVKVSSSTPDGIAANNAASDTTTVVAPVPLAPVPGGGTGLPASPAVTPPAGGSSAVPSLPGVGNDVPAQLPLAGLFLLGLGLLLVRRGLRRD